MGIMKKRIISLKLIDFGLPLLLIISIALLFHNTNLDIILQRIFFKQSVGWYVKKIPFWNIYYHFFFHYGNIPALLMILSSVLLLILGFWSIKYLKYRKIAVLLLLTMVIGPGLIINGVLKEHWGRPRPRDTLQFEGEEQFLMVWEKGISGKGKSFPCGHCSMGYFLFIPFFFLRGRHKRWTFLFIGLGIIYGLLIGVARMIQGGHYASDVFTSGAIVYLVGASLFYLLKMDQNIYLEKKSKKASKYSSIITTGIIIITIAIILSLLLATPYYSKKTSQLNQDFFLTQQIKKTVIHIEKGDVKIKFNNYIMTDWEAHGFGFPGSRLKYKWHVSSEHTAKIMKFQIYNKGFFTELKNNLNLTIPDFLSEQNELVLLDGDLEIPVFPIRNKTAYTINVQKGDVTIIVHRNSSIMIEYKAKQFINKSSIKLTEQKNQCYTEKNAKLNLTFFVPQGTLKIINPRKRVNGF